MVLQFFASTLAEIPRKSGYHSVRGEYYKGARDMKYGANLQQKLKLNF